jgi:hypothetical protein
VNTTSGLDNHCILYKTISSTDLHPNYNMGQPYSSSEEYNNLDAQLQNFRDNLFNCYTYREIMEFNQWQTTQDQK